MQSLSVKESGLILDPMCPFVGASPDGVITCTCCGTGVLKIKCPYSCKNKGLKEVSEEKSWFFLRVTEAGHLELKDNHQYFYQVQLQMKLCNASYCDFVVWSKNQGILVQRLFPAAEFINRVLQQVENFIKRGILPELVGNWYTKSRVPSKVLSVCVPSSSAATVSSCSAVSVCVPFSSAATVSSCSTTSVQSSSESLLSLSTVLYPMETGFVQIVKHQHRVLRDVSNARCRICLSVYCCSNIMHVITKNNCGIDLYNVSLFKRYH